MPEDEAELFPGHGGMPAAPPTVSPPPPPPDASVDHPEVTSDEPGPRTGNQVWSSRRQWGDTPSPTEGLSPAGGNKVVRTFEEHLKDESPWILASAALLVALTAFWGSSVLSAVQHSPGTTAQDRVLLLLQPGSFFWAAGVLLALALYDAGKRFELGRTEPGLVRSHLPQALLAACLASVVAASLDFLVELTNFGHGADRALSGLVGYTGVIVLSGATTWWAHREHESSRV